MPGDTFTCKAGDQLTIEQQLLDLEAGAYVPVDLSGVTVTARLASYDTGAFVANVATSVTDGPEGLVAVTFSGTHLATAGRYRFVWVLPGPKTYPRDGYNLIEVQPALPSA